MMGPKRRLTDRIGAPATLVGVDARIEGRISGKGHFLVAGTVVGDAEVDGAVTLAAGGRWEGNIEADDIVISGELKGEVRARGSLEITGQARIQGRIAAARVAMAEGSVVDGEVRVTGDGEVRATGEGSVKRFEERRDAAEG
jgi:cytoskeletal protein CcmA (bactofilin family)